MFIRGQLVLSINLKKTEEIEQAKDLLESLLPAEKQTAIHFTDEQIANAKEYVEKIKIPMTIKGKEALLNELDPKEFRKYYRASYKNGKGVTVEQAKTSQKLREKALLRKRDKKTGLFLPGKVSKK